MQCVAVGEAKESDGEQWVVVAVLAANYWVSEEPGTETDGGHCPLGNSVKEVVGVSGTTGGGQLELGSAQEFK